MLSAQGLRLATLGNSEDVTVAPPPDLRPAIVVPDEVAGQARVIPVNGETKKSHWCDYLREETAVQTTIMRSPSLSGSLTEENTANVSLGLSLSSLMKANLMEDQVEIRCRRYLAENGLQKLIFLSPQGLTAAGYRAKADALRKSRPNILALQKSAEKAMRNGAIDREAVSGIQVLGDQILVEAQTARSQADRRIALAGGDTSAALARELMQAEIDMSDIDSRMRTLDNVDLSVSAGLTDDLNDGASPALGDALNGKVSFSIKLGALSPKRFEHERRARDARLRAISEEEGGLLWQVDVMRRAHERAIDGLAAARLQLDQAIADVKSLLATVNSVDHLEFEAIRLGARMQLIKLNADRAALEGSLAEIRASLKKLNLG